MNANYLSPAAILSPQEYIKAWEAASGSDEYLQSLHRHFRRFEERQPEFIHRGTFFFGDVIELPSYPAPEFVTLFTKGLSAFAVPSANGRSLIRIELAWTLKQGSATDEATQILVSLADLMLRRRCAFHEHEILPIDFSVLPHPNCLASVLLAHGHWIADGSEIMDGHERMYVLEVFALTSVEAELAAADIDRFTDFMFRTGAEPEDLRRELILAS